MALLLKVCMSLGQGEGEKILRKKKKKETKEICNQGTTKIRGIQGILPKTATKFTHCYLYRRKVAIATEGQHISLTLCPLQENAVTMK